MATKAEKPDTRNLEWRNNNVGSTLLQKMGWKQGQALGSKHRKRDSQEEISGEGLKITKRRDGLGLGGEEVAKNEESTSHASFSQLLESLKQQHPSSADGSSSNKKKRKNSGSGSDDNGKSSKKKKSSSKKETVFASNKITNSRVRQSKFTTKSAEDMACIFGGEFSSAQIIATHQQNTISSREEKKAKKEQRKKEKKRKKEEDNNKDSTEEGSSDDVDKQERKRKRKEEKKRKKKEKATEE